MASLGLLLNTEQNMSAVDCNIPCNILGIRILHTKNKKLGREKRFEVDFSTFSFWASGGNGPPPPEVTVSRHGYVFCYHVNKQGYTPTDMTL